MLNYNNSSIATFLLVASIFIGSMFLYINHEKQQAAKAQIEEIERAELDDLFNIYLRSFKSDLKKSAKSYKSHRKILNEILSPYNFETATYTKENYIFFKNHIAPDLRRKSVEVIDIFQKYTYKLKEDLKNRNSNLGEVFLLKWKEMGDEQLNNYIIFFEHEEQIIQAYEDILKFYYIHSNLFSLDWDSGNLIFDRESDKQKEKYMLDNLHSLLNLNIYRDD